MIGTPGRSLPNCFIELVEICGSVSCNAKLKFWFQGDLAGKGKISDRTYTCMAQMVKNSANKAEPHPPNSSTRGVHDASDVCVLRAAGGTVQEGGWHQGWSHSGGLYAGFAVAFRVAKWKSCYYVNLDH